MKFNYLNLNLLHISLIVILSACSPDNNQTNITQVDLDKNLAVWNAAALQSYQYNFRRSCFCPPSYTQEVIINYANGQIESVVYANDLTIPNDTTYPSIEDLFNIIQEAINKKETNLVVKFHPQYGYPTLVSRDPIAQAVDDEIAYIVDHFKTNDTLYTSAFLVSDLNSITDGAQFELIAADVSTADSAAINFDRLNLTINTTSSCGSSYFRFYISTLLMESLPPQAQTKMVRLPMIDDVCDQPLTYQLVVDLTPHRQELSKNDISEVILLVGPFSLPYKL